MTNLSRKALVPVIRQRFLFGMLLLGSSVHRISGFSSPVIGYYHYRHNPGGFHRRTRQSFHKSSTPPIAIRISSLKMSTSSDTSDHLLGQFYVSIPDALQVHAKQNSGVVFVDGSWWLGKDPNGRSAREAYDDGPRIVGAHFFDIDDVADDTYPLPHMMPQPQLFAFVMDQMHITNQHHVILYGQPNCPFIHRSWYTFIACGHDRQKVHILDGSLQAWIDQRGPIDTRSKIAPTYRSMDWKNYSNPKYIAQTANNVVDMAFVRQTIEEKNNDQIQLVDARSADRFYARVDEPRPGLRRGHMPSAKNLFFMNVLDPNDPVKLKSKEELQTIIQQAGIDLSNDTDQQLVASCGSGATACTIAAAFVMAGKDPNLVSIYDGSWMEWGSYDDTPIVTSDD